jgi:hypothetical protein
MKKHLFSLILMVSIFSISAEVKNPDNPLKGDWDFKPVKTWEITNAGDEVMGRIRQFRVNETGMVYVNDRNKINHIFDKNGAFLGSFAKKGEGPGEVKTQRGLFCAGDMVLIPDNNKIHCFTNKGSYVNSSANDYYLNTPVLFIDEDEFLSAVPTIYYKPDGKAELSRVNIKTGKKIKISPYPLFKGGITPVAKETYYLWLVLELAPSMVLDYDRKNRKLYYGMSDSYKINAADLEGNILNSFSLDRKRKKIDGRVKKEHFQNRQLTGKPLKKLIDSYPDQLTHFFRFVIESGMVYVFLPEMEHPNQQEIDIFSLDGRYLYCSRIMFDKGARIMELDVLRGIEARGIFIKGSYLYAALEDEEGSQVIVKYKITLPKPEV